MNLLQLGIRSSILAATLASIAFATAAFSGSINVLADGQPWSVTREDGRSASITMMPDGTGTMRAGLFRAALSWRETADGFCMTTPRGGEECMVLSQTGNGFVASGPNGGTIRFDR